MSLNIKKFTDKLSKLDTEKMYLNDFILTRDKTDDEIEAVFTVADALKYLRKNNTSARIFDSGLAIGLFKDDSVKTRFSFASAANMLGLTVQNLDENKIQTTQNETVRETMNMVSFMAEIIGIRDYIHIGKGNTFMQEAVQAVQHGFEEGVLEQRPTFINLQCDVDHPTQTMADMLHIINHFDGAENLKGKKIAMSWAYSPSFGKPLSVPQGVISLMTRFGMEVGLAHPEGYELPDEIINIAEENTKKSGGKFYKTDEMMDAFHDADIVYPVNWTPYTAMKKRTELYDNGDDNGITALEKEVLKQNAKFKDWQCKENMMEMTKNGKALYMHYLPADITGINCESGEAAASVYDRYREQLYKQAGNKPYITAAMMFLSKCNNLEDMLKKLLIGGGIPRCL